MFYNENLNWDMDYAYFYRLEFVFIPIDLHKIL